MKTRPINLKTRDVQGVLAGRKTQHRGVMMPQPSEGWSIDGYGEVHKMEDGGPNPDKVIGWGATNQEGDEAWPCPFGKPGKLLWVRETFFANDGHWTDRVDYKASFTDEILIKWHPSTQMPIHLSRLTLKLTDVRVERLQDISEEDAVAEGFDTHGMGIRVAPGGHLPCVSLFAENWNNTHKKEEYWEANPWVWVLSFEVINKNVGEVSI